jgi:hypothetical protein
MSLLQPKPVAGGSGAAVAAVRLYWEGDIFGNNNYQNTGDLYTASQFGMSGMTVFDPQGRTSSGNYELAFIFPANSSNSNESYAPAPANGNLHWYSANGTEVANNTNLAAEVIRVQIWGL